MGYLLDNCNFDRLSPEIINQCQPYKCSKDSGIDSFFHLDNRDNFQDYHDEMMSNSHCFYTDEDNPQMVCAFSLASTSIRTDVLSNNKRRHFNKHIPFAKRRTQYPAILITQLCIFDGFGKNVFGQNIGDEMMDLIKTMVINPRNDVAARYLVVDAINAPGVIGYYRRNGFELLFNSDEEELVALRGCSPDEFDENGGHPVCKTRLMFFDLIVLQRSCRIFDFDVQC